MQFDDKILKLKDLPDDVRDAALAWKAALLKLQNAQLETVAAEVKFEKVFKEWTPKITPTKGDHLVWD